jgi:alanine dehydrogenase
MVVAQRQSIESPADLLPWIGSIFILLPMRIGVPREVKNHEYRVALTPAGAHELTRNGHHVLVERGAGVGSAISDADFEAAGARIVGTADEVWAAADLLLKVKEPIEQEYHRLRRDQVLFTYLHLAASAACTQALLDSGTTAIAYETVRLPDGSLPLLAPMSEVAGRLAPQAGANALMRAAGGRGVLLGGVPGVRPANVVVIGAGVSGQNAIAMAVGLGADVTVLDLDLAKLRRIDERYAGRVRTVVSNSHELEKACLEADLVIGAVLVPGARAPRLVSNDLVKRMKPGSVLVDIAIDQGGCFEDSRPTTHADPTYPVHGSVFYCVANMPGAVPHTSTYALTNATLPYALRLANLGWAEAVATDPALAAGLSTHDGALTSLQVAHDLGLPYAEPPALVPA